MKRRNANVIHYFFYWGDNNWLSRPGIAIIFKTFEQRKEKSNTAHEPNK